MKKIQWIKVLITIAIILCGSAVLIYYKTFHQFGISKTTSDWSNFGNYVTGAVGSVLSFFSIFLIYLTYRNQVKNSILQQFETTFFNLLQNQREIVKSIKNYIYTDKVVVDTMKYKAEEYFEMIAGILNSHFDASPGKFINEMGDDLSLLENKEQTFKRINKIYDETYRGKEAVLGHYFRHLYHIIKYVSESEIQNKKKYIDIIQAQMNDNELYVTFYNCISIYGKDKFLPLLDRYHFFENLRSRGKRFDRHKKLFYPSTKFKYNAPDK